ncbi:hypothetical protein [Bifidobacterium catulorum]|nr:hypothetical protein [Bifidobacterium catulorum]
MAFMDGEVLAVRADLLTGVIGVAQAVYTLVNQAFSGKLSKDHVAD